MVSTPENPRQHPDPHEALRARLEQLSPDQRRVAAEKIATLRQQLRNASPEVIAQLRERLQPSPPQEIRVGQTSGAVVSEETRSLIESEEFKTAYGELKIPIGRDETGQVVVGSLVRMGHLLIAGKNKEEVAGFIRRAKESLATQYSPEDVAFITVDTSDFPDGGLSLFPNEGVEVLQETVANMQARYDIIAGGGYRSTEAYNHKVPPEQQLSRKVLIISDLNDLMAVDLERTEAAIFRLAARARAVGIHMIIATIHPSVDVSSTQFFEQMFSV